MRVLFAIILGSLLVYGGQGDKGCDSFRSRDDCRVCPRGPRGLPGRTGREGRPGERGAPGGAATIIPISTGMPPVELREDSNGYLVTLSGFGISTVAGITSPMPKWPVTAPSFYWYPTSAGTITEVGGHFALISSVSVPASNRIEVQAVIWQETATTGEFAEIYVLPLGSLTGSVPTGTVVNKIAKGSIVPYASGRRIAFGFRVSATPGARFIPVNGRGSGSYTVVSSI